MMADPLRIPPARRSDLVVSEPGEGGGRVVKDRTNGRFFQLGPAEAFLFLMLDGRATVAEICEAFERQFGDPLDEAGLDEFVGLMQAEGFLAPTGAVLPAAVALPAVEVPGPVTPAPLCRPALHGPRSGRWQETSCTGGRTSSIRIASSTGWSQRSALSGRGPSSSSPCRILLLALGLVAANLDDLIGSFLGSLRFETLALAWIALIIATFLHEFAHGLTCKHYGGEVHEVGFLLVFGLPCFYCNVSDAWLFPQRYKRLLVTLAGGYCDLCIWAVAVFVWRLTPLQTPVNYVAYVILTLCGGRIFFNFNPFLRLDGYYLLSDWINVPNLQQRSRDRLMGTVRWTLWGGARPEAEAKGRLLLLYGAVSWLVILSYGLAMFAAVFYVTGSSAGLIGRVTPAVFCFLITRSLFEGLSKGEVKNMFLLRHWRLAAWLLALGGVGAALAFVEIDDRRGGAFLVRPGTRAELRARALPASCGLSTSMRETG